MESLYADTLGTVENVLISEVSPFSEVVLYIAMSSWDPGQRPDKIGVLISGVSSTGVYNIIFSPLYLFSHTQGMNSHPLIQYNAEKGLQEVLCTLDGRRKSVEEMATRIKLTLDKIHVHAIKKQTFWMF